MGTFSNIHLLKGVNLLKISFTEKLENHFVKRVSDKTINILLVYTTMKPLFCFAAFAKTENLNI